MAWWEGREAYTGTPTVEAASTMRIDIYHHFVSPDLTSVFARLDRLQRDMTGLVSKGNELMATTQELLDVVSGLVPAVAGLAPAIDALEAAVTAALESVGGVPAADQANIDAAFATLQTIKADVAAAVADAVDGVDEAKV
jgi:uncharacterized protein YoxC